MHVACRLSAARAATPPSSSITRGSITTSSRRCPPKSPRSIPGQTRRLVAYRPRRSRSSRFATGAGRHRRPVCRFYIPPQHGDSHFFSASTVECAAIRAKIGVDPNYSGYVEESPNVFYLALPNVATGACPAGRPFPSTACGTSARIPTTATRPTPASRRAMIAKGYVAEGYGPDARRDVHARGAARRRADPYVRFVAVRARLRRRARERHRVRQRRGRTVRSPSIRRIRTTSSASGSRTAGRTAARAAWHRVLVRRRRHVDAHERAAVALHRRHRRQRRQLRARVRSVGHVRARRHGVPGRARLQQPGERRQRDPRQPLDRRRPHVEHRDVAAPRYARRTCNDKESITADPHRRALRLRGVGPPDRQQRPDVVRAHDRRRRDVGSRAHHLRSRAATARRSTTRSSCCPTAR